MASLSSSFEFLSTMAGNQAYLWGMERKPTYSRIYEAFGGSNQLRERIAEAGRNHFAEGFRNFGKEYHYPYHTSMPDGGFFLLRKTFQDEKKHCTNFDYALSELSSQLEKVAEIPIVDILNQCSAYGIKYILNRYFECVRTPEDGDLVVYELSGEPKHAGLYSNWNFPKGSVKSKWEIGFVNPYVFQHDVFFIPPYYGNVAKFYHVKKHKSPTPDSSSIPAQSVPSMSGMDSKGHFHFVRNESNADIRKEIDHLYGQELVNKFPQIELMKDVGLVGKCHDYAYGKILKTYSSPENVPLFEGNQYILDKYFTPTEHPTEGDLVVYYNYGIAHYGIYCSDGRVESKWGSGSVHRHPPFYVPNEYGDEIVYYKIKDGLTPTTLLEALQKEKNYRCD